MEWEEDLISGHWDLPQQQCRATPHLPPPVYSPLMFTPGVGTEILGKAHGWEDEKKQGQVAVATERPV